MYVILNIKTFLGVKSGTAERFLFICNKISRSNLKMNLICMEKRDEH